MKLPDLPIHSCLPALQKALSKGSAVLTAPPGSGKTTIAPLALLDQPWLKGRKILILEPRRIAARAAASRMAALLDEHVGQTVGYQIRFERKISRLTRVEVLTEGILTRRIQQDADLRDVGLVIFDEFHERSIHADLALTLCLDLLQLKDDLRLLVMSATLETEQIAAILDNAPVVKGEGSSHQVDIEYLDTRSSHGAHGKSMYSLITDTVARGVQRVYSQKEGDILVFLPGVREIRNVLQQLSAGNHFSSALILPLFGDMSQNDQDRVLLPDPAGRRRIILATSIAETSLTLEGVSCVIDSGWSRRPEFEPKSGLTRLKTVRVSQASAKQRMGRAGRQGPGYCLRLWSQNEHFGLLPCHPPEILNVDLADLALELSLWGVTSPDQLSWLDPPPQKGFEQAQALLLSLGAVDPSGMLTNLGKRLALLPVHPRIGRMLTEADRMGYGEAGCDIAALLSERDLIGGRDKPTDVSSRLELLNLWRKEGPPAVIRRNGRVNVCRRVHQLSLHFQNIMQTKKGNDGSDRIGDILVSGYPDRIAKRRDNMRGKYLLANGRGSMLSANDPLIVNEYLVAPSVDAGTKEGRIYLAEPLSLEGLKKDHQHLLSRQKNIHWDESLLRVTCFENLSLGEIILEQRKLENSDPEEIMRAMLAGLKKLGAERLPWNRESRQLQARLVCLSQWCPDLNIPDVRDEALIRDLAWLEPYLDGMNSAEHLASLNLHDILLGILSWEQRKQIDTLVPERLKVASGSKIRLQYREGEMPVLAVKIQEIFGWRSAPAVCSGTVGIILHLLSPAGRPVQVTSDLAGFWKGSYPEVKKELKGRYPKHYWPDAPQDAAATKGVRQKKK